MVFKLCVSTPPLEIVVYIRASPKNSPAGSSLRIVQQEGFWLTFASPLRIVRASQFEKRCVKLSLVTVVAPKLSKDTAYTPTVD